MSHSENVLVTSNDHFEVVEKTTIIDDSWPTHNQAVEDLTLDHFITRDGKTFAGTHIIAHTSVFILGQNVTMRRLMCLCAEIQNPS